MPNRLLYTGPFNADHHARARTLVALESMPDDHARAELYAALDQSGSIDYARKTAQRYVSDALKDLAALPDSPAKAMLKAMADAVITRSY